MLMILFLAYSSSPPVPVSVSQIAVPSHLPSPSRRSSDSISPVISLSSARNEEYDRDELSVSGNGTARPIRSAPGASPGSWRGIDTVPAVVLKPSLSKRTVSIDCYPILTLTKQTSTRSLEEWLDSDGKYSFNEDDFSFSDYSVDPMNKSQPPSRRNTVSSNSGLYLHERGANAILQLYSRFRETLPELAKTKLLSAAVVCIGGDAGNMINSKSGGVGSAGSSSSYVGEDYTHVSKELSKMFHHVVLELESLRGGIASMELSLSRFEDVEKSLYILVSGSERTDEYTQRACDQLWG